MHRAYINIKWDSDFGLIRQCGQTLLLLMCYAFDTDQMLVSLSPLSLCNPLLCICERFVIHAAEIKKAQMLLHGIL